MAKKVSNITFMPVVESISRKFALRKETCSLKGNDQGQTDVVQYMGSGTRTKKFNGTFVTQNYFFMRKNARLTQPSSSELDARAAFTQGNAWALAARSDLMAITANQQKFKESNASGGSKRIKGLWAGNYTMLSWMRAIAIKMVNDGETLPQDHLLPAFDA